jgi:hypothetical protein
MSSRPFFSIYAECCEKRTRDWIGLSMVLRLDNTERDRDRESLWLLSGFFTAVSTFLLDSVTPISRKTRSWASSSLLVNGITTNQYPVFNILLIPP